MSRTIRHPKNVPPVATFEYPRGPRPPEPFHPDPPDADRSQCALCRTHQSPANLFCQVFEQAHVFLCRACFDETADRPLDTVCALQLRIAREAALTRPSHPGFPLELALVVTTVRARQVLIPSDVTTALTRHARGEWGLLPAMVAAENEFALTDNRPVVSCYESSTGERFWLVTDATRIFTTVLLDEEYFPTDAPPLLPPFIGPIQVDECFGGCPECGGNDGYLNVGRVHYFTCDRHRTAWWIGSNWFASWRSQTEAESKENFRYLKQHFRLVEPVWSNEDLRKAR